MWVWSILEIWIWKDSKVDLKGPSKDNEDYLDDEECEGNRGEQIFDFVEVPSFVTLFTSVSAEPLLLFEDYWKSDFRWNSYGCLGSCSTARVTIFQRELFETSLLTKYFLQKIQYNACVCYYNTWQNIWYLCGNR